MQVAIWDTYVKKQDGSVLHFDIVVPETERDAGRIFQFGKAYLASMNEATGKLETEECQFCHMEDPAPEVTDAIRAQGYYIIEMEDIPAELPDQPTRRDLVLHLRGHYAAHRFADFRGKSMEMLQALISEK